LTDLGCISVGCCY